MLRVLCLTSWFPPHHFGGYELSCHDVMARLVERGHHVEVLTSDHRHTGVEAGEAPSPQAVHRDLRLYLEGGELRSPGPFGRVEIERHNQRALAAVLATARPDVVAVWHVGAMSLGLLTALVDRGVPLVHAVSDDWPAYAHRLDAWTRAVARIPWARRPLGAVTGVPTAWPPLGDSGPFCFISELTRQRVQRSSPWSLEHTSIVYSGIDRRLFTGDVAPRTDWSWRLLFVGRPDERKGVRTLLRALARLPQATLVVDGRATPSEAEQLDRWARQEGVADRVEVQASTRAALPEVYADADVCVFASEWEEPFGLVPLEAMACSTPVVATGVGGSAEFLAHEGNCLVYTAGDATALAAAVARLAEDPPLRERLVDAGHATAEFFDVGRLTDAFEVWYAAAAAGFPDGAPPRRVAPAAMVRGEPGRDEPGPGEPGRGERDG